MCVEIPFCCQSFIKAKASLYYVSNVCAKEYHLVMATGQPIQQATMRWANM